MHNSAQLNVDLYVATLYGSSQFIYDDETLVYLNIKT